MPDEVVNVRYMVDDVEEAVAFYTTHFGFALRSSAAPAFADVVRGNLRLLLSGPASSAGRPMPDGRTPQPGGWNRIHFIVEDIAAEVERLRAAGLTFRNDIAQRPGGPTNPARRPRRQSNRAVPAACLREQARNRGRMWPSASLWRYAPQTRQLLQRRPDDLEPARQAAQRELANFLGAGSECVEVGGAVALGGLSDSATAGSSSAACRESPRPPARHRGPSRAGTRRRSRCGASRRGGSSSSPRRIPGADRSRFR